MILYLEDRRDIPDCIDGHSVKMVATEEEFTEGLMAKPDMIFLDHDLCTQHYRASRTGEKYEGFTGLHAAALICGNMYPELQAVVIHSTNTQRAVFMQGLLETCISCPVLRIPFEFLEDLTWETLNQEIAGVSL